MKKKDESTSTPKKGSESITASIIKVVDKKAKIKSRPGSARYKRLALLLESNGKTVKEYYAACDAKVGGTVSKKLMVVAVKQGLVTLTQADKGNKAPVLSETDINRYNYKRKVTANVSK